MISCFDESISRDLLNDAEAQTAISNLTACLASSVWRRAQGAQMLAVINKHDHE